MVRICIACVTVTILLAGCSGPAEKAEAPAPPSGTGATLLSKYTPVRLTADLGVLTEKERAMIPLLIEACEAMDEAFWIQAWGDSDELLTTISDGELRRFARINYGPWDRLDRNRPFIDGVGPKPAGANFYPADATKEEIAAAAEKNPALKSLYTMVRRDEGGGLRAVPYSKFFQSQYARAAGKLRAAAALAEDPGLKRYLELRAEALVTDKYQPSDLAWMDMKDNTIDVVIGPIETYEDQLFGYKAASEGFVLVKDKEWSARLARYTAFLPELQSKLPVAEAYRREKPGLESDLNAYDVIYYAGDCNAGSKTIAINLPNDEEVQLRKGTRRLQLKNAMRAKFDRILLPLSDVLVAAEQRPLIRFDAFFSNVMFHEVAHGLGIKNTVNGRGTVRQALQERASALEEAKADVLGLFMITQLIGKGELESDVNSHYVTFMASIFRSVRFGAASAHGRANLAQFNFLNEAGAFAYDPASGAYRVNLERMKEGVDRLARTILTLQGDGDYDGVTAFMEKYGRAGEDLQRGLDRLASGKIPVDIVFEQGPDVLGLR